MTVLVLQGLEWFSMILIIYYQKGKSLARILYLYQNTNSITQF